jgi:segregation and condensation protein B
MSDDQTQMDLVPADPAHVRIAEALLFAAAEPLDEATLARRLPEGTDMANVIATLARHYEGRGVILRQVADRWAFFTAPDLAYLLEEKREVLRKLSRAATETLAIIAYHQPITRSEIEELRGVALSKGTLDVLLDAGWVRMRGRRRTPGRPVTYGTNDEFLVHFGLASLDDLPGIDELRAAGLLETQPGLDGLPTPGESLPGREEDPLDEGDDGTEFQPPIGDTPPEGETESRGGTHT